MNNYKLKLTKKEKAFMKEHLKFVADTLSEFNILINELNIPDNRLNEIAEAAFGAFAISIHANLDHLHEDSFLPFCHELMQDFIKLAIEDIKESSGSPTTIVMKEITLNCTSLEKVLFTKHYHLLDIVLNNNKEYMQTLKHDEDKLYNLMQYLCNCLIHSIKKNIANIGSKEIEQLILNDLKKNFIEYKKVTNKFIMKG